MARRIMSKQELIQARTPPGFRDYLPETMLHRERLMGVAREVYRSFGFSPIDTPALEYFEVLAGKGSEETDRQMFNFQQGKRHVAMRFDLTVPLARFVAQYAGQLGLPFKRYQIAPVWRGERPQRGRYREFIQCDFDTIGSTSVVSDIEMIQVVHQLFCALGFAERGFTIRVNNREVLSGLLEKQGLLDQSTLVLRALDKLPKIGAEEVAKEMAGLGLNTEQAASVLALADCNNLDDLAPLVAGNERGEAGVARLRQIIDGAIAGGVAPERLQLDVSIARGLDYYTGVIIETFLNELPGIGSVCSGGRYDNLAGLYTKQHLPGIGASLGLDRLLAAMEELEMLDPVKTPADILIVYFDKDRLADYLAMGDKLRAAGVATELYPDPKKIGQQLKYADQRGFRYALIAGGTEFEAGVVQLKNLATGESQELKLEEIPAVCRQG